MLEPLVWLHFACNDPDSGAFTGTIRAIELSAALDKGELLAEVELIAARPSPMAIKPWPDQRFRAFGRHWPYKRHVNRVGNQCWDAYQVAQLPAAELLTRAIDTGRYSCSGGLASICAVLDNKPVDYLDLRAAIRGAVPLAETSGGRPDA